MDTAEAPQRNLLIRADSSSRIGLGHIMRDLVLAQQYPNADITFACQNLEGNIIDHIPYPVHILATNDPAELIELIISHHIDMVIFDHYGIDAVYEKRVKDATKVTILCLDDTYEKHFCDILINPNVYAQEERYNSLVPAHTIIRCGKEFLLIREEFYLAKKMVKPVSSAILISMGGSDPHNLSMEVLHALKSTNSVHLLTTTANPHLGELQSYSQAHPNIQLHVNASNIALLMQESSLAVITPSSIANEVIFMGLPFIAIQSAENQSEFVAYMEREGFDVLPHFDQEAFQSLLEKYR